MTISYKYSKLIQIFSLLTFTLLLLSLRTDESYSLFNTDDNISNEIIFSSVVDRLIANKSDPEFVKNLINHPSVQFNEKYIRVNVIKSMQKVDYSAHYSDKSAQTVYELLRQNFDLFQNCENQFSIPKEIIAAIIWVETKFGSYLGNSHVPSVYLNTALANEAKYIEKNLQMNLKDLNVKKADEKSIRKKIKSRSAKKANWAIKELLALEKIYNERGIDIFSLYGSWAGAFGISQFLPSSYLNWAIDGNKDGIIDLFDINDAVFSVANYLKNNGWGNSYEEKRKAIFNYNNSSAYVDAILKLSEKVKNYIMTSNIENTAPID